MKKNHTLLLFAGLLLLVSSCKKDPDFVYYYYTPEETQLLSQYLNLPEIPDNYHIQLPKHLKDFGLVAGQVERDKAILGRVLFYDKHLSKDEKISCASCHKQELGFSDDKQVSTGVFGRTGNRNAIALSSVASFVTYYGTDINGPGAIPFFWDNRAPTAGTQNKGSMTNPAEMGMQLEEVVTAVKNQPFYAPLFRKAFGTVDINEERVSEAIAHFVNAMGSYKSKFDEEASKSNLFIVNQTFAGFTASENRGMQIYMNNCSSCHSRSMGRPPLFFSNNGLDADFTSDEGVGGLSGIVEQKGCFKVPTLRNIGMTAPYMHDGRFQTLEEVVEHYNSGIQNHPNLAALLKTNNEPKRMNLTATDKQDLIHFLHTLTDNKFLTDTRFSNPFK